MYYSYIEIEYVATSFSPARGDLAVKLLTPPAKMRAGLIMITKLARKYLYLYWMIVFSAKHNPGI